MMQPNFVKARLMWTDPPYGTGKIQSGSDGSWTDASRKDATNLVVTIVNQSTARMSDDAVYVICLDDRIIHQVVTRLCESGFQHHGDVIWESHLGRPRTTWWPRRHSVMATFTFGDTPGNFDPTAIPRTKRLAPKANYTGDKPSGSVWEYTMSNTDPERVGYPNQKPLAIIRPFILAHTVPGDTVVDPFMGSGSTGVAAQELGREFWGVDTNPEAIRIALMRLPGSEQHGSIVATAKATSWL
jgi:DNA modification methylase